MKCTVLVPSFNRLPSVVELVTRLCRQDYPDFEILVIEQSTRRDRAALAELERMASVDPRLRIERHPPLWVGGARNAGMASARGEIVLIIDDDDLPRDDDWISRHLENYEDPKCIAVHGSEERQDGGGGGFERRFPRLAQRCAMSYSPFGTPLAFPRAPARKENSAYLRGGNSSIRRSYAIAAGGWVDECKNGQEEHDFSFRLRKIMRPGEYIAFDPRARMIRRMDIPGGADRRSGDVQREIDGNVVFYYRVLRRHWPLRVLLLVPIYPLVIYFRALAWIVDDRGHEPFATRFYAVLDLTPKYPFLFMRAVARLFSEPSAKRHPIESFLRAPQT